MRRFVRDRLPKDCKVSFNGGGGDNVAVTVPESSPWVALAEPGARRTNGAGTPVLQADGGSIPVVATFQSVLEYRDAPRRLCPRGRRVPQSQ